MPALNALLDGIHIILVPWPETGVAPELPEKSTEEHIHPRTEEIYYVLKGKGRISIEGEERNMKAGDGIAIMPGKRHKVWNTGKTDLVFLCCCAPAYTHEDTIITE